ncbi:hypothetical protein TX25_28405 [Pseudomonas lactis]|nr:hypothetical protein TX25_28405 [Pseudomonas lactis]
MLAGMADPEVRNIRASIEGAADSHRARRSRNKGCIRILLGRLTGRSARPLQAGLRFFRIPLPAAPTAFLAVRLPFPAALRAYPVPPEFLSGAAPLLFAGGRLSMMTQESRGPYLAAYRLVQACQHIWLVEHDDV